jgi:hypothetical protein
LLLALLRAFAQYIENLFGYNARWTSERLRVAEALEHLPELDQRLRNGMLSWSAVRELTRVAVPENEHQWIRVAKGRSLREIEELVSGHRAGDSPGEASEGVPLRRLLRFEVSADTYSTFREAMAKLRRDTGGPLDDDEALLLMARSVLGGPTDAGRGSYQVALTVCEDCGRGWQNAAGQRVAVDHRTVEMAGCDAQEIGQIDPIAKVVETEELGGERLPHVGDEPQGSKEVRGRDRVSPAMRQTRARHDVPPATRRQVVRRDGGRCVVPGCRHGVFLDIHHVRLRSEGGDHDPEGLVVLCAAHHRAVHRGQLIIEGRVSTGLEFRHADGSRYGSVVEPRVAEANVQAFRALRTLGFREDETRRALERVRAGGVHGNMESVLRAALGVLT